MYFDIKNTKKNLPYLKHRASGLLYSRKTIFVSYLLHLRGFIEFSLGFCVNKFCILSVCLLHAIYLQTQKGSMLIIPHETFLVHFINALCSNWKGWKINDKTFKYLRSSQLTSAQIKIGYLADNPTLNRNYWIKDTNYSQIFGLWLSGMLILSTIYHG